MMRKLYVTLLIVLVMLATTGAVSASPAVPENFVAPLSGSQEVPARDTKARGTAFFQVSADGTTLNYILIVANLDNPVAAHIHCGAAGVVAPVGLTLFSGGTPGGGRVDGILAQGTKMAPDPGNACGWVTLADVVAAMRTGNTYTNVHTNDGIAPPNTGPGDFPGGEIRGQNK